MLLSVNKSGRVELINLSSLHTICAQTSECDSPAELSLSSQGLNQEVIKLMASGGFYGRHSVIKSDTVWILCIVSNLD